MNIEIKHLCNNLYYAPCVANWIFEEWVRPRMSSPTYEQVLEKLKECNDNKLPIRLIALLDNKCIGTIALVENDLKTKNYTPWLAALYIDKNYRNHGIGAQLVEMIKTVAKDLGYLELYLRTETAGNYYKKLGWQLIESCADKDLKPNVFKINL